MPILGGEARLTQRRQHCQNNQMGGDDQAKPCVLAAGYAAGQAVWAAAGDAQAKPCGRRVECAGQAAWR
jgi:hypothetical protein